MASLKRRLSTLRLGDPLDKNTDIGAINSAAQLAKIRELSRTGRGRGRRALVAGLRAARQGVTGSRRRSSPASRSPTGSPARRSSGRSCRCSPSAPRPRPSRRRTTRPTGCRPECGRRRASRMLWMASKLRAGGRVVQHVQQVRPHLAVRWVQGVGLRARGRSPRARGVPRRRSRERAAVGAEDVQAVHRRCVPALGEREVVRRDRRQGRVSGQRVQGLPQGRSGRPWSAARKAFRGWSSRDRVQPGADPLPDRRDAGGPPRRSSSPEVAEADGRVREEGRRARRRGRRPAGSGTPGGPTRSPRCAASANPVSGPYFNLSTPEPTGVVGDRGPAGVPLFGLVSVIAPVIVTGNTCVVLASEQAPLPLDHPGRGAGHLRPAGRGGQHPDRVVPPRWPPWMAGHMDVNGHRPHRGRRRAGAGAARSWRRRTSSGCCGRNGKTDWAANPGHPADDGVPGDQDGLAPRSGSRGRASAHGRARSR